MYLNPTVQLHTSYELIEHLLELNKPRKMKGAAGNAGAGKDESAAESAPPIQLLSKQKEEERQVKKQNRTKLVDIFEKQKQS